ncbi:MAG: formylglycine-generating enzyme family protein [Phycisphaerae bacterium]|nr:formylglycine-generating enzyme family protein [Phycisphaerae bacterium]
MKSTTKKISGTLFLCILVCIVCGLAGCKSEEPAGKSEEQENQLNTKEVEVASGVLIRFVEIPMGRFMMGSPSTESGRHADETRHEVILSKPFYMGVTEVTQALYEAVMGSNPSDIKGPNRPVDKVSWDDAVAFCDKLTQTQGGKFRLPTEAEWEYACRAGTTTPFNTGKTISTDQANYDGGVTYGSGTKGVERREYIDVASFSQNRFGLYDMHGNVWEWCSDWLGDYPQGPVTDPHGPDSGSDRVRRGGSWFSFPGFCRSAEREGNPPDFRGNYFGFRVVLDLE